jgi:hypothetical protein
MSCRLTHCPHVDRLLISSSVLPECPVNNGVDNGIELCRGSITCPQNYRLDQGSALVQKEKNDGEKQNFVTPGAHSPFSLTKIANSSCFDGLSRNVRTPFRHPRLSRSGTAECSMPRANVPNGAGGVCT